ncbi:MAG: hypothetical protein V9E89_12155 [Ilumatobacteraceae bacterium]
MDRRAIGISEFPRSAAGLPKVEFGVEVAVVVFELYELLAESLNPVINEFSPVHRRVGAFGGEVGPVCHLSRDRRAAGDRPASAAPADSLQGDP